MYKSEKKPLFRKVNTKARGVHHDFGVNYDRTKKDSNKKMTHKDRGMDYTPLYKFLLSKVGQKWDDVYSEAVSRIDKREPVFHIVTTEKDEDDCGYVRVGESSFYSQLYVDENGILRKVNPDITESSMEPVCKCCTHTFNGVQFTKKFKG